uniref:Uncharacterized protein n=1 Tax=Anguilla anguilla TaxID=7936 RepID=A0A0E9VZW3_ANGAN
MNVRRHRGLVSNECIFISGV